MKKKLPYGLTDYVLLMTDDYYFVDKTKFIELLENTGSFLFLHRPRRFGKSLFLSMLHCYYGITYADRFEELFGDKYIGKHPTAEQGKYLVLSFNFSAVHGTGQGLEENFNSYAKRNIEAFAIHYSSFFEPGFLQEVRELKNVTDQLHYIGSRAKLQGLSIYLLIDEFDHFVNTKLSNNAHSDQIQELDFFNDFFNTIKSFTTGTHAPVKRIFITGVSPAILNDVTNTFNIGTDITSSSRFNEALGFSESELITMLSYYKSEGALHDRVEDLVQIMKPWYNNYCFAEGSIGMTVYNPNMVLYFLNHYLRSKKQPEEMADPNNKTGYNKLQYFINMDKMHEESLSVFTQLINSGEVNGNEIKMNSTAIKKIISGNFVSILYYLGLLSYSRKKYGETLLKTPNLSARNQIYTYQVEAMKEQDLISFSFMELSDRIRRMAYFGEWRAALDFFSSLVEKKDALSYTIAHEPTIKALMIACLGLTDYYTIWPKFDARDDFSDLYLMPNLANYADIQYSYLIRLQFLQPDDTTTNVDSLMQEAESQIRQYTSNEKVLANNGNTSLRMLTAVYKGWQPVTLHEFK